MLAHSALVPSFFTSPLHSTLGDWNRGAEFNLHLQPSHIEQTDDAIKVDLAVPGFKEEEVQVTMDGNLLKIKAEHADHNYDEQKDSSGKVIGRSKRWSSSNVMESFRLPSGLNTQGMTKCIENGVLKLHIPRLAIADRPQQQHPQEGERQQLLQNQQPQREASANQHEQRQQPHQKDQIGGQQQSHREHDQGNQQKQQPDQQLQQRGQQQQLGQQQRQQLMWPPHVSIDRAGNNIDQTVYSIALPNVNKEDLRINVENGNLYLTLIEHTDGHSFLGCGTCTNSQQSSLCSRYSERSVVVRLPTGTTAEDVSAKLDGGNLRVTVNHRARRYNVNIA